MTFNPNFITKIVTTALILPMGFGSVAPEANAQGGQINGYQVNVIDSGSYDRPDSITVWGPKGVETVTVTCAPFDWSSYGANTVEFIDSIARAWCF